MKNKKLDYIILEKLRYAVSCVFVENGLTYEQELKVEYLEEIINSIKNI